MLPLILHLALVEGQPENCLSGPPWKRAGCETRKVWTKAATKLQTAACGDLAGQMVTLREQLRGSQAMLKEARENISAACEPGSAGEGSTKRGGCPASVGHLYAFGNTEEEARVLNLGAKGRGREVDGALNHKTGKGWVAQRDGCYVDVLANKKNEVEIIIHEPLGGGFSPPALAALHRNSKTARAGTDRTKYTCPRPISYYTHYS